MSDRYAKGYLVRQEICFADGNGFVYGEKSDEAFPLAVWNFVQLDDRREYTSGRHFLGKDADLAGLDFGDRVSAYKSSHPNVTEKYNYLAAAEMSDEQNYNQIDGIPNNGYKPSILEQLRDFKPEPSECGRSDKSQAIER